MKNELTVTDKIELSEERREELDRKEARNTLIKAGVGVATVVVSFMINRKLDRQLVAEFTEEDEPTTNE